MSGEDLEAYFRKLEEPATEDEDEDAEPPPIPPLTDRVDLELFFLAEEYKGTGIQVFAKPLEQWSPSRIRNFRIIRHVQRTVRREMEAHEAGLVALGQMKDPPGWKGKP